MMVHSLCFNHLTNKANSQDDAVDALINFIQALLAFCPEKNDIHIYSELPLLKYTLSDNLNFESGIQILGQNEPEMAYVVYDILEKNPYYEHIPQETLDRLTQSEVIFEDVYSSDLLIMKLCDLNSWPLVTIPLDERFNKKSFLLTEYFGSSYIYSTFIINNIYNSKTAEDFLAPFDNETNLDNYAVISEEFNIWFQDQSNSDKKNITDRISALSQHPFDSGKRTSKILGTNYNIRELRLGSGETGSGRIRIFYSFIKTGEILIINGFIKHDNEYDTFINKAEMILQKYN